MTDAETEERLRLIAQKHLRPERIDKLLHMLPGVDDEPQVADLIAARVV